MKTNVLTDARTPYIDDPARLWALAAAGLPAEALEPALDRLTRLAATLTGSPTTAQAVLLGMLDQREPCLARHVREVAVLARDVAVHLGLEASVVEDVTLAANLHDVGKLAIPDGILEKAGPLDEQEWAMMRRHTLFGERIVGAAPALRRVAKLVRSSHERWDGAGYPDGLAGAAIPLGSRIILACDAYDAITSERPYAASRTPRTAEAELRTHAGGQFDPSVADALIAVLECRRELA